MTSEPLRKLIKHFGFLEDMVSCAECKQDRKIAEERLESFWNSHPAIQEWITR